MNSFILSSLLLFLFISVRAGGDADSNRFAVSDFFMGASTPYYEYGFLSQPETRILTARSVLLNRDLSEYQYNSYREVDDSRVYFGFSVNRPLRTTDKYTYRFRLGLSYSSSTPVSATFTAHDSIPWDTLTSSQTGSSVYVKKVFSDYYNVNYSTDVITFDLSGIISTSPLRRFSFYTGLGLCYGLVLSSETYIYHSNYSEYFPYGYDLYPIEQNYYPDAEEQFQNRSGYSLSLYVPVGINFRFGKSARFWKRLYMYYEFSLGMNMQYIPELGSYSGFYPAFRGGYRYYFGKMD